MLKRLVNEARFVLRITTAGPVLVRSGHQTVSGPDMTPVRTHREGREQAYLPGSSLKGVARSHLEKICRTLNPGATCNPFVKAEDAARPDGEGPSRPDYAEVSCSEKFEIRKRGRVQLRGHGTWTREAEPGLEGNNEVVYRDSCAVCRLFGSQSFIGRVSIGDAYLDGQELTEARDGVGIDRVTGGAAHGAEFELEAVSSAVSFQTAVLLRNFECWQLGMLLTAAADMADGMIRVGSGRSRGLGAVTAAVGSVTVHTLAPTPNRQPGQVWGLGRFLGDGSYGTSPDDALCIDPGPAELRQGVRQVATFDGDSLRSLQREAQDEFQRRLEAWPVQSGMAWPGDWSRESRR